MCVAQLACLLTSLLSKARVACPAHAASDQTLGGSVRGGFWTRELAAQAGVSYKMTEDIRASDASRSREHVLSGRGLVAVVAQAGDEGLGAPDAVRRGAHDAAGIARAFAAGKEPRSPFRLAGAVSHHGDGGA